MTTASHQLADIPGLVRCETNSVPDILAQATGMTRTAYPHEEVYGDYCTIQQYIDCPPEDVFDYLSDINSLDEYSVSTRAFEPAGEPGLFVGWDTLAENTRIYMRLKPNREALTLDYHCAWDQGEELWMIYLFRIVPAEQVLGKPGSVVLWTNCHHPNYDKNPYPELSPDPERIWVGDLWPLFYAGHRIELENLKRILEYRSSRGLPVAIAPGPEAAA
ncbi:SRPBCC family protein [Streptomyces sp. SCSIO ZS0520]|uniref:SRPBCC family protein n=1 Tax=Streptomyces sp. SCSIO ZS0520 TaxID=2892996 RepID=UPI0021D9B78C|nr:SRPBCC family protein [Streptomyces sp. SCSIO ZS0520]